MSSSSRAVSPVIANILLVAVVVILAGIVSTFALGFIDGTNQPGPIVGQSSGDLMTQDGFDGGIVRINHVSGDTMRVSDMEIVVDASSACNKRSRIVNLPADSGQRITDSNYDGDDIFDQRFGSLPDGSALLSQEYSAGDVIVFRLDGECPLDSGDTVTVRVVHTPTNSVPIKITLTAT